MYILKSYFWPINSVNFTDSILNLKDLGVYFTDWNVNSHIECSKMRINKSVFEAIIRFHNIRIWNYFFSDTTRWNAEFLVIQRYLTVLWLFSLTYLFCIYFVIYEDMLIPCVIYKILNIYRCVHTYTCTLHNINWRISSST